MQNHTIIRVNGTHFVDVPPEEASLTIRVGFEGSERASSLRAALAAADIVRAELAAHEARQAISQFSNEQVYVSSHRPWSQKGEVLPLRYNATTAFNACFTDFTSLGECAVALAAIDGVTIAGIDWDLSTEHRTKIEREVAHTAVQDAVRRAESYAQALGLGAVRPLTISDDDMFVPSRPEMAMHSRGSAAATSAPSLELSPEAIRVAVTIKAEFAASA